MSGIQAKAFLLGTTGKVGAELKGFLNSLRKDALLSTQMVVGGTKQQSLLILYQESFPKVTGQSPADGSTGVVVSSIVSIVFDEKLGSTVTTSYIEVLENGVVVTPTVSTSSDGYSVVLSGVFATAGAYYQIKIRAGLPFESGRTFSAEHTFSFKNA